MVRKSIRALVASGLSIDEVDEILNGPEGWLAWTDHPSHDCLKGGKVGIGRFLRS